MANSSASRVVLVTGGSRGIGRAIVEKQAAAGDHVYFCSRNAQSIAATAQDLGPRYPGKITGRICDVRDAVAVEGLIDAVAADSGRLDVLVNNAGLGYFAPVDEMEVERFREVLETNLFGAFFATRAAAKLMKRQGEGWIFNIASLAAKNTFAGGAAYNASKFAMVGFSEASMLDLRHYGIRVAAICPGSVATEFRTGFRPEEEQNWMLAPEDVAQAVADLLAYPARALPSLVELRPSRPPKK
ncbi:MAG: SDR family oxidoreductase [Thermoanaerobaculia bacterium]